MFMHGIAFLAAPLHGDSLYSVEPIYALYKYNGAGRTRLTLECGLEKGSDERMESSAFI